MFEADEMEGCHSCKYGDEFDIEKEPCKYCYGLSMYTKKETKEISMSGGSHNYIYSKLSVECEGEMQDEEMNAMIKDICDVLHDLEWWQSGDYSED